MSNKNGVQHIFGIKLICNSFVSDEKFRCLKGVVVDIHSWVCLKSMLSDINYLEALQEIQL